MDLKGFAKSLCFSFDFKKIWGINFYLRFLESFLRTIINNNHGGVSNYFLDVCEKNITATKLIKIKKYFPFLSVLYLLHSFLGSFK